MPPLPHPSYHWSPTTQRRFLAVLAETGSIGRACAAVSKSREAAYALRRRSRGRAFATGWDAALIAFRQQHADAMMGHALQPIAYDGVRHPETRRLMWRRADPFLGRGMGMTLLTRMDRAVAPILADSARAARAHAALEDFDAFLDAIAVCGGEGAGQPFYCQLARIPGGFGMATGEAARRHSQILPEALLRGGGSSAGWRRGMAGSTAPPPPLRGGPPPRAFGSGRIFAPTPRLSFCPFSR